MEAWVPLVCANPLIGGKREAAGTRAVYRVSRRGQMKRIIVLKKLHGAGYCPPISPRARAAPMDEAEMEMECIGTGQDVECVEDGDEVEKSGELNWAVESAILISPFFFWGTAMVAMKEVLPKTGPLFVAAVRLIPSGLILVLFALSRGRTIPSGFLPWFAITLFALVDAACFQAFLAQGLLTTTAGLGSVIIDSQPLTVAILAAILFGESIGAVSAAGLVLGIIGLLLLEGDILQSNVESFWGSGEWWMFLAAQSMAIGTIMVRWVCKYSDPIMATGWHMVIGGLPLLGLSILQHDPAFTGEIQDLGYKDWLALAYTSAFGSAISYGLYFYNATRGSLTKLSSLTFLTPMFASLFGYFFLDETLSSIQLLGAVVTAFAIYLVNKRLLCTGC